MALSQADILALPEPLVGHFQKLEQDVVARIAKHIGDIGEMSVTDVYLTNELQRVGYNVAEIQREVAALVQRSEKEIFDIFSKASEMEYDDVKVFYDLTGKTRVPFADNARLQELIGQISAATHDTFVNMSNTTALRLLSRDKIARPVAQMYQQTIDYAILQAKLGQTDFHTAMRSATRTMAREGLAFVEYESGYVRRLDSSIRMNLLGGLAELSHAQSEMIGREFGADGMEISWHNGHRPTHDFGGQQFSMDLYYRDILPLMQEPNCYHRSFPIILGISTPAYSQAELKKLNDSQNVIQYFEGRGYDAYQAQQRQRQYETAIRREKDYINAFDASSDRKAEQNARIKLKQLNTSYKAFSDAMNINMQPKRIVAMPKAS